MYINSDLDCCAIHELGGICGHPIKEILSSIISHNRSGLGAGLEPGCAFYIFSQAGKLRRYGTNLANYIKKNNLGKVTSSGWKKNPNSGNLVKVWTWEVNWENLAK